ncbi:RNA polymerase sigma-70 factor (ECF subfamily) [Haloferula luteola]|uniref:RNA polymerase sigma-70 factor (ECF subfamily) n=1 Tax=Haloferula luteola TaxID=595692 RepID=A0A840VDM6_9BACT|nr:sigma-70 family RNA polymerase sigma factor [Haloferula luteola]MBB5351929.1 RNA polymerase sigma-70 factor (ECF subfamily) [Haloferula luteola]
MSDDPQDLDDFVEELTRHQVELIYFIRTLVGDVHAAMDIRQAVNMVMWKKRSKYRPGSNFRSWAFRIAHFEVKKYLRSQRRSRTVSFDGELLELFADEFDTVANQLPERRSALSRCITKLTAKDLELLRHRYWSDEPLEMLASATNRSIGTLKARLHQLRASLRTCIERQLGTPS